MNKHKKLPLFWAAFSLLLLFTVNPAMAGSNAKPADVDTLFNCTWTAGTVTPVALLDSPVVTVGGNMYLFGGVQGGAITAASFKFDGTTWTPIAPLPTAVEFPAAVTDGTDCYILGGALTGTGTPQTTVYKYNVALNTYTTLAPFTTGTWNHSAVYLAGKIYKFAGTGPATASTNANEIYTVASNSWAPGAAYPLAISFTSGWTQGGFIYGAGGIDSVTSTGSAKTFRYDPVANTWDDVAIADMPATRWGAATAFYAPDVALCGGYVAGSVTANISPTVINWDQGSNTWLTNASPMTGAGAASERSRATAAVLGSSVYVVGGRSIVSSAFAGTNSNQKLTCLNVPTSVLSNGGSSIAKGGSNGVINPGNTVTVALGVKNTGGPAVVCTSQDNSAGAGTGNIGTLQPVPGVIVPGSISAPQKYGGSTGVCSGITPALTTFRYFTFQVEPTVACGSTVTLTLQMTDTGNSVTPGTGTLTYTFVTGKSAVSFAQNFDGVVAPALPAGWTSTATGIGVPWVTSTTTPASAPNDAFAPDPSNLGDSFLVTPTFAVPAGGATLSFKINYITESTFDGVVLETSTDGINWADVTTGGNAFISGGYTGPISTAFQSSIAGRQAWNGTSPGSPAYVSSAINMPASTLGQPAVQLRWRMATDNSVAATGVRVDDVSIANPDCSTAAPALVQSSLESPGAGLQSVLTHGGAGTFGVPMTANVKVTGSDGVNPVLPITGGVESRRGTANATNVYNYKLVVPFTNPITTLGTVSVTSRDGGTTAASLVDLGLDPTGKTVVVNLTAVADLPQLATAPGTGEGQILGITLADISDGASKGNVDIQMGILIADSNDTRNVSGGDSTQVKSRAGLPNATTFRSDVNPTDGLINSGDTQITKNHSGNLLPGIP